jgi:peptidoglycan/LPS O-acetylase OafA/YrhL
MVVVFHELAFVFPDFTANSKIVSHMCVAFGGLCVRIFFEISGFVITRLLLIEEARDGSISLKAFYIRRSFRILPVYYVLVTLVCLSSWLHWTPVSVAGTVQSALFMSDFKLRFPDWFLGHSWSLAVEEHFYLLFPLFWIWCSPRNRPKVLIAILGAFTIWSISVGQFGPNGSLFPTAILGYNCINVGALMAIFEKQFREFVAKVPPVVVLLVSAVLWIRPVPLGTPEVLFDALYEPFALALMLMFTISQKGWTSSVLKNPALQWIGLISYSGYLWQQIFTGNTNRYGSPAIGHIFHLALPLLVLVAAASYYWIERPCTRLGRRFSTRARAEQASVAAPVVPAS